jgi:hypothetical protein
VFAFSDKSYNYLIRYVFEPCLQSVPNIVEGPTKKNMVPATNTAQKTKTPNIYKKRKQFPEFFYFLRDLIAPYTPQIPSIIKTADPR